ncbi:MAG: DNA polymerase IV [Gemmatimonadota bacterium]
MARTILHVDMDAFFAAIEEREDPTLGGRPIVVGADPKGGRGRGVVAAANYEARKYGIASAMPISQAYRRCPRAVYLRPRMALYREVSSRVFDLLGRYTDLIEPLSIDEAFLDVTASRRLFGDGASVAGAIKREIRETESLTASVGVACSKFVAKLASDLEKPDGLVVVPPGEEREFLAPLGLHRLWGAGPKTVAVLRRLGASTIGDVARLGPDILAGRLGEAVGQRLYELSLGVDERPVEPERERKSLSREVTFEQDVADRTAVERTLLQLCQEVGAGLRQRGLTGCTVTLKLRWEGFETVTRRVTLHAPVDTGDRIWAAALPLFRKADRAGRRIRLIGVGVSQFIGPDQLSLFEGESPPVDSRVAAAVDRLAERFGPEAVTRAALLDES